MCNNLLFLYIFINFCKMFNNREFELSEPLLFHLASQDTINFLFCQRFFIFHTSVL